MAWLPDKRCSPGCQQSIEGSKENSMYWCQEWQGPEGKAAGLAVDCTAMCLRSTNRQHRHQ